MRVIPSMCTFCGVGSGIGLRVHNGRGIGVEPQPGHPVSQGQLCSKGWSGCTRGCPGGIDVHGVMHRLVRP